MAFSDFDWPELNNLRHLKEDHLREIKRLRAALVEIEASGSCYCARDVDGQRLGCKCPICVARAILNL